MKVSAGTVCSIICEVAKAIDEKKEYLSELDRAIGDGDHGFNMARGFGMVMEKIKTAAGNDIGEILKTVAVILISTVGGSSGPLYGSLFLKASVAAKGMTEFDLPGFVRVFREGVLGVQDRGKARPGDKTMVDVLVPVLESLEKDCAAGVSGREAFTNAEKVAAERMEWTKSIIARKGRASYLGERSIGHIDPGAASSYLMVSTISKALEKGPAPAGP